MAFRDVLGPIPQVCVSWHGLGSTVEVVTRQNKMTMREEHLLCDSSVADAAVCREREISEIQHCALLDQALESKESRDATRPALIFNDLRFQHRCAGRHGDRDPGLGLRGLGAVSNACSSGNW